MKKMKMLKIVKCLLLLALICVVSCQLFNRNQKKKAESETEIVELSEEQLVQREKLLMINHFYQPIDFEAVDARVQAALANKSNEAVTDNKN